MSRPAITIPVRLDKRTFRRFAFFDAVRVRHRARRPAVFSLILLAFAAVALFSRREQSGMIAAVLLAVGAGLPLVYFGSFLTQINLQAEKNSLKPPRLVYTLTLGQDGVHILGGTKTGESVFREWKDLPAVYRTRRCIYLYASPAKAFLIPRGQGDAPYDRIWQCFRERMPAGTCHPAR